MLAGAVPEGPHHRYVERAGRDTHLHPFEIGGRFDRAQRVLHLERPAEPRARNEAHVGLERLRADVAAQLAVGGGEHLLRRGIRERNAQQGCGRDDVGEHVVADQDHLEGAERFCAIISVSLPSALFGKTVISNCPWILV